MRTPFLALTGALVIIGSAGCFALKLDDFPAPRCAANSDCEHLNRAEGIAASACQRYQCAAPERVCALVPRDDDGDGDPSPACGGRDCDDANPLRVGNPSIERSHEICDGVDNNCDGVIDEGAFHRGDAQTVVMGIGAPTVLASSRRTGGGIGLVLGSSGSASAALLQGTSSVSLQPLQYISQVARNGVLSQMPNACPVLDGAGNVGVGSCGFDDAALAPLDSTRWFLLSLNLRGCASGQLRAGWFDESARQVTLSAPASPMAVGVDVSSTNACTGASRMPPVTGASSVALASIPVEGAAAKALGAWVARPANAAGCGASANVEAMGLWLASSRLMDSTLVQGVRGTNGDRSVVLGATSGSGAPAVVGAGDAFVVAYGANGGGINVHLVPSFAVPDGALDAARPPFVLRDAAASSVDQVSISVGPVRSDGFDLGVVWKDGCASDGGVWFSRVAVNRASPMSSVSTTPLRLALAGRRPVLWYTALPMLVEGTRRGTEVVSADNSGGWVVAWVEGAQARARRISAMDGAPVDPTSVSLGDTVANGPGLRIGANVPAVMPRDPSDEMLYVMPGAGGTSIVQGGLICRARSL